MHHFETSGSILLSHNQTWQPYCEFHTISTQPSYWHDPKWYLVKKKKKKKKNPKSQKDIFNLQIMVCKSKALLIQWIQWEWFKNVKIKTTHLSVPDEKYLPDYQAFTKFYQIIVGCNHVSITQSIYSIPRTYIKGLNMFFVLGWHAKYVYTKALCCTHKEVNNLQEISILSKRKQYCRVILLNDGKKLEVHEN